MLPLAEASGPAKCTTESSYFVCRAPITNTTDQMGQMTAELAFYDSTGTRVESDGRFQEFVAAGQTYLSRHSIQASEGAVRGEIISVQWDKPQEINTTGPVETSRGLSLPVNTSKPPANCKQTSLPDGEMECTAAITNTYSKSGEITTTVAFYDASGLRLESESRFESAVKAGETFKQSFFAPTGTKTSQILAIHLSPK